MRRGEFRTTGRCVSQGNQDKQDGDQRNERRYQPVFAGIRDHRAPYHVRNKGQSPYPVPLRALAVWTGSVCPAGGSSGERRRFGS